MRLFFSAVGLVLAVLLILGLISFGISAFTYVTAPWFGAVEAERQIESGVSRRAFYDRFFDMCAGVQAVEGQLEAQRELLASLEQGTDDWSRVSANVAGLEGRLRQEVAEYNAQASKDYTAARFLDEDLPPRLDADTPTRCSAPREVER